MKRELRNELVRLFTLIATLLLLLVIAKRLTNSTLYEMARLYFLPLNACGRIGSAADVGSCKDILNAYFVLILSALAFAIPFKVSFFNVGVEGQGLAGTALLFFSLYFFGPTVAGMGSVVGTLSCLLIAGLGGVIVGLVPYFLWRHLNINGVVSTLIVNLFVAAAVTGGLSSSGLMDKSFEGVQSQSLSSDLLRDLSHKTFYGLIEAPVFLILFVVAVCALWVFWRSRVGLVSDAVGNNIRAASILGFNIDGITICTVLCGAAFGGVVGLFHILEGGRITLDYFRNVGFEGIGVAVFGGYRPFGMIIAGLFIALWRLFGNELQMLGLPSEIALIGFGVFIISAVFLEWAASRWMR